METSIGSVGEATATLPALASFFVVWRSRTRADARPLKGESEHPLGINNVPQTSPWPGGVLKPRFRGTVLVWNAN